MAEIPQKITVEVVTPERRVITRECDEVILPGTLGSFGVLPGHAAMLSSLQPGVAVVRTGNEKSIMAVGGGFAEVLPDRVIVLAETCEKSDEIDVERAKQAIAEWEQQLKSGSAETDVDVVRVKILKHSARISATQWR
ncbi:MAG: F0F1 ATP synthase subunit epsilon [Acidobacteriota bacterium]